MTAFRFKNVCIEALSVQFPDNDVTSAALEDKLAPMYERLKIPFGTLEKLSGISSRKLWDVSVLPSHVCTQVAKDALEKTGFDKSLIGAIFNCSVSRDFFEPSVACLVHGNLRLPEKTLAFDITNACIGFTDGMITMANMIESGVIKAGILTSGETITRVLNASVEKMLRDTTINREMLLKLLPTFTLGSGAVSFVLCHSSVSKNNHRFLSAVARCDSDANKYCVGNADFCVSQVEEIEPLMETDSAKLMAAAAQLGSRCMPDFTEATGWKSEDINHIFCHQVGKQVNEAFYNTMGLDITKEFTIYKNHGNLVSAAMPAALTVGVDAKPVKKGDKVLCTAYGSGLNSRFLAIEW